MKHFRVHYVQSSVCSADVWAETEEEARDIAEGMDGGEFDEDPTSGDWEFFAIQEIEEG